MKMKFFPALLALLLLLFAFGAAAEEVDAILPDTATGSLGAYAFWDGNGNAERGDYEVAYTHLHVELLRVVDDSESTVAEMDVNSEGVALFEGLEPGTYRIRTTCQAGHGYSKKSSKKIQWTSNIMEATGDTTQTSRDLTVKAGEELKVGVAVREMASLSGFVWLDENENGVIDEGETGMAGAVLELKGTKNNQTYTLTTDDTGIYQFTQVIPGSYKLYCTIPDGTAFTVYTKTGGSARSIFTTAGKTTDSKAVDLNDDLVMTEQNVGLVRECTITGICFLDANYNGVYDDGEEGLGSVKLELSRQSQDKVQKSIKSSDDGTFTFSGLRSYVYKLRAVLPEGYCFTRLSSEERGNHFKYITDRRENTLTDIKVDKEGNVTLYIGAYKPATITGTVYFDNDFSGAMNGKESTCSGISVGLYNSEGERLDVSKTTNKGKFTFDNVPPGDYYITCIAKSGYAFTKVGDGNIIASQSDGRGASAIFHVGLGETVKGLYIGMIQPGTVQGSVFGDANDNGRLDSGETGLAGTVVSLISDEGVAFSTTLDETGTYCFDAVMPGRYCVRYELPEGSAFATAVSGSKPEGSSANTMYFDFAAGDVVNMEQVGGVLLGTVSGTAFEDLDADGRDTEGPLAGVEITLTPSRSDLEELIAVSGEDGTFTVSGLHPDTYTLTVRWPDGYVQSRTAATTLPLQSGLAEQSAELKVTMGDSWTDQLLGGVKPAALNGGLWLDANMNGIYDEDESGLAGEEVTIIDLETNSVFAVLTTAEDGTFSCAGMIPGEYRLEYALGSDTLPAPAGDSTFTQDGDTLVMDGIQLVTGDALNSVLLGLIRYTAIGGSVWADMGGEIVPTAGAVVTLSGAAEATAETGEDGTYTFTGLLPGEYRLSVTMPDGVVVVDPDDARLTEGGLVSVMTSANSCNGSSDPFTVVMVQDRNDLDIGGVLPGRVGDFAWLDLNGNGLQDGGESGIPGITVSLLLDGEVIDTTVTDQYGYYFFRNVYPDTYTLSVSYPAEVKPTVLRSDFPSIASVLLEDGSGTLEITVESSKRNYSADLGFVLVTDGVYPEGYGEGTTMNWKFSN